MLKFAKKSSQVSEQSKIARTPDTMTSTDTVEVLLGISEGPIKGLVDGPKSFKADDTPLVDTSGTANFSNFGLDFWPGDETGHAIRLDLGGFASPLNIGVTLAHNTPVVRTGVIQGINAVDFRILVQQLLKQNEKDGNTLKNTLSLKFEVKKTTDTVWLPAWISEASTDFSNATPGNGATMSWRSFETSTGGGVSTFSEDVPTLTGNGAPSATPSGPSAIYLDELTGQLYRWGTSWSAISPTSSTATYLTYDDGRRFYPTWGVAPTDAGAGDLWWQGAGSLLIFNGSAFVKGYSGVTGSGSTPPVIQDGVWTIDEKVTNAAPKDIRVYLSGDANTTWQYRVTKLSPDSTSSTESSIVSWESVQEITIGPMTFKGLSMVRIIGQASDQFSSIPNWSGEYEGRLIKVPSNYDPVARTYAGVWDGTYKIAYSNNPAFVLQDFVENNRYGLSSFYPHIVNKWKFYEWGVYCDVPVQRADGQLRPRWTYNDYMQETRDAREMAQYIAGSAGGLFIENGDGVVTIAIDQNDNAVCLFTPENVGEDGFSYSYSDRLTRPNETIVEFVNPQLNWQTDKRIVRNQADIDAFGRISENFVAVGCTDADEAMARARRRLIGGLTEKETVTFTTNRKGKYLAGWDIILVSDPEMGRGISGRIHQQLSTTSVKLRETVSLEPSVSYFCNFDIATSGGFQTLRVPITTPAGVVDTLTFGAAVPTLPPYAAFSIEAAGTAGIPKPYRILNIEDDSGVGEVIKITALELNRNKYTFVDTGVDYGTIDYGNLVGAISPPTNLQLRVESRPTGGAYEDVGILTWTASTSKFVQRYEISHQVDDGADMIVANTNGTNAEIPGLQIAAHVFSVVAIGINGKRSPPALVRYDMRGEVKPVNGPQGLHLVDAFSETIFDTLDATFAWAPPLVGDASFSHYRVDIIDIPTQTRIRGERVNNALTWTYKFADMVKDGAGSPRRSFEIRVYAISSLGTVSAPAKISVSNAAPAAPTLSDIQGVFGGVQLQLSQPTDRDIDGVYVWIDSSPTFDPVTTPPVVDASYQRSLIAGTTLTGIVYIRAAYYDKFSKDPAGLNISAPLMASSNVLDLGGRTAEEWVADFNAAILAGEAASQQANDLADAVMEGIVTGENNRQVAEARAFINDQPIGTFVLNQEQRTDDLFNTLALVGVKGANGNSFELNGSTLKVSPTESLADRFNNLVIDRDNAINLAFVNNQHLWSDGISALGSDLSLLGATSPDRSAFVLNQSTVKWDANTSLAAKLTSIQSQIGTDIASATTSIKTWVDSSSAGASWINTLEASFGNNFRARMVDSSNISNGLATKTMVSVVNGKVIGLETYNNGYTGGFIIYSDYFGLVDPNNGNPVIPFKYEGGICYLRNVWAEKVKVGTITADHIISDEITRTFSGDWGVTVNCGAGGNPRVVINVYAELATSTNNPAGRVYKLLRNGSEIGHGNVWCPGMWGGIGGAFTVFDMPGGGSHTYTVTETVTASSGASSTTQVKLVATVLRR